jgi:nucleoside-triphosphatase
MMTKRNILITGPPGCGKSTLIEKIVNRIERPVTGFFTREIKKEGRRVGYSVAFSRLYIGNLATWSSSN